MTAITILAKIPLEADELPPNAPTGVLSLSTPSVDPSSELAGSSFPSPELTSSIELVVVL